MFYTITLEEIATKEVRQFQSEYVDETDSHCQAYWHWVQGNTPLDVQTISGLWAGPIVNPIRAEATEWDKELA